VLASNAWIRHHRFTCDERNHLAHLEQHEATLESLIPPRMAKPTGYFTWDLDKIAQALQIEDAEVKIYFTDGRRVSFLLERRISREVVKGTLATSEGAGWDLIDTEGGKWEVRSITRGGIYFCPSYMVGSGRFYDESGFLRKLAEVKGYIVSDIEMFPTVPYWVMSTDAVTKWHNSGQLGAGTKISRATALRLLSAL